MRRAARRDGDRPQPAAQAPARRQQAPARRSRPQPDGVSRAGRPDRPRRPDQPGGISRTSQANRPRRPDQPAGGLSRPLRHTRTPSGPTPSAGPTSSAGLTPTANRKWGSVARRGARTLTSAPADSPTASEVWRQAVARASAPPGSDAAPDQAWVPEETWIEEPQADEVPRRGGQPSADPTFTPRFRDLASKEGVASPGGRRRRVPRPVVDELSAAAGAQRGGKLATRMADATYAFERERYEDARRILRSLASELPASAAVRELYGLVLYRTGQWAPAARQLETYRELSRSFDQHPVLADCYRALGRYGDAEEIWNELREASPSGDLVGEGRIVAAGCRADQGDLAGAIALLERAERRVKRPQERHLRQWYALADLYERAGDIPRARELFARVATIDPDAFDVRQRLRSLR